MRNRRVGAIAALIAVALCALAIAVPAWAEPTPIQISATPVAGGGTQYSVPVQTLVFFTALSFLPAVLLMMTSFTRIIIVLSLMRMALGTQTTPPNQVLLGLALFLTLFIMGPTVDKIYDEAYVPYTQQRITFDQALGTGAAPLKTFMLKQTRAPDLELFSRLARLEENGQESGKAPREAADLPIRVIIPAFVTSELKTAFQIGFMVYIPFLVIDMVVASVMMAMGMMMLSPVLVALPIKLMLFVLADGWNLLIGSLVASYSTQ